MSLTHEELSREEFPKTWEIIRRGVSEGVAPSIVAGLYAERIPDRTFVASCGDAQAETKFDLASLTKIVATTSLAAILVQRGWLTFETPLRAVLPQWSDPRVRIRHLLSHTAGLIAHVPFFEKFAEIYPSVWKVSVEIRQKKMREFVLGVEPEVEPGSRALYSDLSFLLLGFALEEITQMPLDRAVEKFVWAPMGVPGFYFHRVKADPLKDRDLRVAPTEDSKWRGGILQGQVHDDNAWAMGGYAGHAGVFGSVGDVLLFARATLNGFFAPEVRSRMWSRVSESHSRTLGWDTPSGPETSARGFSSQAVGHLGFTGTSLWIEPDRKLAVALLTNRVHPSRENWKIRDFRPKLHEIFRAEIDSNPRFK